MKFSKASTWISKIMITITESMNRKKAIVRSREPQCALKNNLPTHLSNVLLHKDFKG